MSVKTKTTSLMCMLLYYHIFTLVEKYPMIISTPHNLCHENAQSPNRSTCTCTPEFMVLYRPRVGKSKSTGSKFRSSYFRKIGMGAKNAKICTMQRFPTVWYVMLNVFMNFKPYFVMAWWLSLTGNKIHV